MRGAWWRQLVLLTCLTKETGFAATDGIIFTDLAKTVIQRIGLMGS